jgi:hypothetical protein
LARLAYENELSSFAEMTRQGREVTPLMRKRAMQRYENQIGKLKAVEATEASKAKFWDDVRSNRDARLAREQKSREYRAQAKSEWEQATQNAPPVKSIDDLNAEYTRNLGQQYAAQQQEQQQRHSAVMGGMVPHRAEERADWLTPAIKNAVASAVDTLRQSPAGQLSNIAAPSTTTPAFGEDTPEQKRMRNALADVFQFARDLRHTPGTMNYDRDLYGPPDLMAQSEADQAAVDKSARDTFARLRARPSTPSVPSAPSTEGLTTEQRDMLAKLQSGQMRPADPYALETSKFDPVAMEASRRVSDRYRAMGVDTNHPDVYSKYASDVDREIAAMTPTGQVGAAPGPLPMGKPVGVLEGLANAGFGPGGLFGPPLPPDAAERAINMAPTQNARAAAQGQAATGAMQEPFYVLVGGGMIPSMKGGAVPEMTAPGTRVIDNPMLRGRTNPTFSGPGRFGSNSNMMDVTPGRPARPVTVIPGAPGEIVDMPPTQAMPGVTPRDLPTSGGSPQAPSQLPELMGVSQRLSTPIEPPKQILRERAGLPNPSRPSAEQVASFSRTQSILDDLAKIGFFGEPNAPTARPATPTTEVPATTVATTGQAAGAKPFFRSEANPDIVRLSNLLELGRISQDQFVAEMKKLEQSGPKEQMIFPGGTGAPQMPEAPPAPAKPKPEGTGIVSRNPPTPSVRPDPAPARAKATRKKTSTKEDKPK